MKYQKLIIEDLIERRIKNSSDLAVFKRRISKKYKILTPSNIQLLKAYHELARKKSIKKSKAIEELLKTRPIRSLSGIVNISVLTKPYPCPGKCIYCPLEKGLPKSYLSGEPAVQRAKALNFDPYNQTKQRIKMLRQAGHPTDKIDFRVIGGTWSYYPKNYQTRFIKRCFDACNKKTSNNLTQAQKLNESAKHRIIGLSVETRPDFINENEIKRLRNLGITKVELGVQSTDDNVLKLNLRGHKVKETIKATKLLKNAGFKISYQIMPNLLGSTPKKDIKSIKTIFSDERFRPDLIKIYPCALVKEAPLYRLYKKGKYRPYSLKVLIKILCEIKKQIPYYTRIERIIRDIPAPKIVKGPVKISNLREVVGEQLEKQGYKCKCIRCREIKAKYDSKEKIYLFREDYNASGGKEIFLTFENKNRTKLYSLLRLRILSGKMFLPVLRNSAIIREIHTYGQLIPISKKGASAQHKGLGKKLIQKAENITENEFGLKKITVISAVGARGYWRKFNYKLKETYMVKLL
ncbi:MAG: elongator complex protein 3 [Candidatus Nealsonbacteria bacterium]